MPGRQQAQDFTGRTPPYIGSDTPPLSSDLSPNLQPNDASPRKVYRKSAPTRSNKRNSRSDPSLSKDSQQGRPLVRRHTDKQMRSVLMEFMSSLWGYQSQRGIGVADPSDDEFEELDTEVEPAPNANLVYRIQTPSDLLTLYHKVQQELDRQASEDDVDGDPVRAPAELLQPSTIYVSARDASGQRLGGSGKPMPRVYYAQLTKLPSAQDREKAQAGGRKSKDKAADKTTPASPAPPSSSAPSSSTTSTTTNPSSPMGEDADELCCIVRVVTVQRMAAMSSLAWQSSALAVLRDHGLASGHTVVPSELRRQLKLDATGSVWVKAGTVNFHRLGTVVLFPISVVPRALDNKMLEAAFRKWVEHVADPDHPMVVFHGMLVRFPVTTDPKTGMAVSVEAQLCLGSGQRTASLLCQDTLPSVTIIVQRQLREDQPLPGVITPMLAYRRVDDFDPQLPSESLDKLGAVNELTGKALRHLEACLGSRPLPRKLFGDRPGLNHGMLLVTGPKGSGKTCLANALAHEVSSFPTLAYTFTVNCKPFRGKRVETLQSMLEAAFDEAAWRQPAVIVIDDLDVIAPAPDGPGNEMSGEALYAAKVSEVFEGLVKFEMRNFSRLALIVTSQSRSSLHPSIVASRGLHFVQEVATIKPPDKEGRKELLRCMLKSHSTVLVKTTLQHVDLDHVASRTEGFVARDMQVLINRALHTHLQELSMGTYTRSLSDSPKITLDQVDFEGALEGFKPVAIRKVALHTAGDLGWTDIGGLEHIKAALVETLQWPSKYPQLFSSCPLRLRSGLLLYGPPGTGKTLLAGAVAKECCLNFVSIKGPELLSKYIGASEQAVRDLFIRAQSAKPCILFFDEFDSIAPKRGHDSTGVTDRVVNQLLTQLDGVESLQGVYMLAATSRPDLIDPALLRPGRLDKCLYCNIPSQEERRSILKALTQKMSLQDDVSLDDVADMCEHFTGADFKALLYNAQLQAIHEYTDAGERLLETGVVRIQGSPDSCSRVTTAMPPITIRAKNSSLSSPTTPSPTHITTVLKESCVEESVEDGKVTAALTVPVPGPGGDAVVTTTLQEEQSHMDNASSPDTRRSCSPPNHLEIRSEKLLKVGGVKGQVVTFFPSISESPAVLTPEDEARFLSMVEAIHRRQNNLMPKYHNARRRASSVLAKPSVLMPVAQRHLLAAAKSMKPSVSASERLRYQAIYDSFISGRQGDFNTDNQPTGLRATLA